MSVTLTQMLSSQSMEMQWKRTTSSLGMEFYTFIYSSFNIPIPACCTTVQTLPSFRFPRNKECVPLHTVTPINSVFPVAFKQ